MEQRRCCTFLLRHPLTTSRAWKSHVDVFLSSKTSNMRLLLLHRLQPFDDKNHPTGSPGQIGFARHHYLTGEGTEGVIFLWPDTATTAKVSCILRNGSRPAGRIQSGRARREKTYLVLGGVWHEASQRLAGRCIVRKGKHRLGSVHRQKSSHKLRVNSFSSDPKDL